MDALSLSPLVSLPLTDQTADSGIEGDQQGRAQATLRLSGDPQVRRYASQFADLMEMRAPADVVGRYLDRHEDWFRRCAAPMTVASLGRAAPKPVLMAIQIAPHHIGRGPHFHQILSLIHI